MEGRKIHNLILDVSKLRKIFLILISSCIFLVLITISPLNFLLSSFIWYFFIFFLSVAFISISIIYGIVSEYGFLKNQFYLEPLKSIQEKVIKRDQNPFKDAAGFVPFSMMFSLMLFVLFSSTPILNAISSLPIIQLLDLPLKLDEKLFQDTSSDEEIFIVILISYAGPIVVFLMRHFHHKLSVGDKKRYPGSRPILGMFYTTAIVIVFNLIFRIVNNSENVKSDSIQFMFTMLTILSAMIAVTIWFSDRVIFSKLNRN